MAKSAKKRQKKPRNRRARAICWLNAKDLKVSSKGAFRFAPPLPCQATKKKKTRGKRASGAGIQKRRRITAPAPMNCHVRKLEEAQSRRFIRRLSAFRWIVGRLGEGCRRTKARRRSGFPKKKTPRPKSRGVFFRERSCKDRRIRVQEAAARRAAKLAPRREGPDKRSGRRRSRSLYIFCLNSLATSTINRKAETVSSQPRVFKPQSGLIHSLSAGITRKAFSTKPAISPRLGTRGLWMS